MFLQSILDGFSAMTSFGFWILVVASAILSSFIEQPGGQSGGRMGILFLRPVCVSIGVAFLLPGLLPSAGLTAASIWSKHWLAISTAPVVTFVFLIIVTAIPGLGWLMTRQALQLFIEALIAFLFIARSSVTAMHAAADGAHYPGVLLTLGYAVMAIVVSYMAITAVGIPVVLFSGGNRSSQSRFNGLTSPVLNSTSGLLVFSMYVAYVRLLAH